MINLCTCTGGSTSTIRSSKRPSGTTVSCKNCGGRPVTDGKRSSSCLLSTVLELTNLINSDFTWSKISKGCRSTSRRPRTSSTISLVCGELLCTDSQGLEMPVSESEKLGVSVLGCHFGEKVEHIPIKKRRFLFRASSPPRNTINPSLEGLERHETSPKSLSHGLQYNSNTSSPSVISEAVTRKCEIGNNGYKLNEKVLVKDDDFSGISILAAAACSNSLGTETGLPSVSLSPAVPKTVEYNENSVKNEESSSLASTTPSKGDESTLNKTSSPTTMELTFSKRNEEPSIQGRDVRFSWDLNTVMDAWEEPLVSEHEKSVCDAATDSATVTEKKKNECTIDSSESVLKSISNQSLHVDLKSLAHENEDLKLGKCEPLSCECNSSQYDVVVKTESLHDKHIDSANDFTPVSRNLLLENQTHGIFSKWGESSGGFTSAEAVDTKLSMDCSAPPGFDHCLNLRTSKENNDVSSSIVSAGNIVKPSSSITQTVSECEKPELSLTTAISLENGTHRCGVSKIDDKVVTKMEDFLSKEERDDGGSKAVNQTTFGANFAEHTSVVAEDRPAAVSSLQDAVPSYANNGFGYDNSQSDNKAGVTIDKPDELSVGYDSQYEDGELRESSINVWKGYELNEGKNEYGVEKQGDDFKLDVVVAHETCSQNLPEGSSGLKLTEVGSGKEADKIPSTVLPEKILSSEEVLSGSGQNEMICNRENSKRHDNFVQIRRQSDEWKMNVSGWDVLPKNQGTSSNNFNKTRNFISRKFSYREEEKDGFDTEDVEMKAEGSRFYRKETLSRIGASSTHDMFVSSNRGRFRLQGCSSKTSDGLSSRPERESGGYRSFGRGRYSPHNRPSGRGGGTWNRSPERGRDFKRLPSPSYHGPSLVRSIDDSGTVDNMTNEVGMDPNDTNRPYTSSYVTRRQYRSRSPMNQEANDYRARLGLRPTGDTGHDRFVNMGRGRGRGRYTTTRHDGEGPRGRYHGPATDEYDDEFLPEYSRPFPRRRRCFSPTERRGNNSYQRHQSVSRSPSRHRTRSPVANSGFRRRSRSPNFRIRRPRSPSYRDHPIEYNSGPRNNHSSPPSSRWVNYKDRPVVDRRSPPPGRIDDPQGERFRFCDTSRKPKQNEYYRSGHPGRFSDINEADDSGRSRYMNNDSDRPIGYRRGGFVRRYVDGLTKRFYYDDEDGLGRGFDARDKHVLELHARSNANPNPTPNPNAKLCSNGTDSRFRDFPRRVREDVSEFKRRSREEKDSKEESEHIADDFQRKPKEVKDQSATTTTTNLDSMMPNEVEKDSESKPMLGPN